MDVTTIASQLMEVRQQRLGLESLAKQIKAGPEAELEAQLLMYLDAQGVRSVKTDVGTVHTKRSTRVEIDNLETLCIYMYNRMSQALREGKSITDGFVFQQSPHKGILTDIVRDHLGLDAKAELTDEAFNAVATQLGVRAVSKVTANVTKNPPK